MSEGKAFGFEKPKTKIHLIAFRLDDQHWQLLETLFKALNVQARKDRMTDKMILFIERVGGLLRKFNQYEKEHSTLLKEIQGYRKEKMELEREAQRMVIANRQAKVTPTPQPSKSEAKPLAKPSENMPVVKEESKRITEADPYSFEAQCRRRIRVAPSQQSIACSTCRAQHREDYIVCQSRFKH